MAGRSTAILGLVTLLLAAFVYFYELRGEAERARAREAEERVFPEVEAAEVAVLTLVAKGESRLRALRRDSSWQIVEPVNVPGDAFALDAMARTLAGLSREGEIEAPETPSIYGLGDDSREIHFLTEKGEYVLKLGSQTPVGANRYAAAVLPGVPGERIYLVPSWRVASLLRGLHELRDRKLMRFDPEATESLELSFRSPAGAAATVRLTREGDNWRLSSVSPGEARAVLVADEVEELLAELARLEADDVAAESMGPAELSALGLRPARVSLRVLFEEEAAENRALAAARIGDADPRQTGIFAQTEGRAAVYRLDPGLGERIPLDYAAFSARFLAPPAAAEAGPDGAAEPPSKEAAGVEREPSPASPSPPGL